jgi:Peptidase_C39 like family
MQRRLLMVLVIIGLVLVGFSYSLILQPSVQTWAGYHLMQYITQFQTWLHPPQKVSFSTSGSITISPFLTLTAEPPHIQSTTPTQASTPIPAAFLISGGKYFSQHNRWNYCGPANLAMLLSYLGWSGTADDAARFLKPFPKDKNVMPYEMLDFIQFSGFDGVVRVGGDLELLKRLIANGYPVLVEKGPHFRDIQGNITWMGHYQILNGYDDLNQVFTSQDSYIKADYPQPYDKLIEEWRSFNYTYLVAFSPEKRNDVLNLLGADADETTNYQRALSKAGEETFKLRGVDQFFAFYNYGSNLVNLRDFAGAAKAYDTAFALYDSLPEDMSIRPYRILWYQTGPYFAYYYTGRYTDVIDKATANSIEMVRDDLPALEESYYWRGMAEIKMGEKQAAIDDFYTCLKYHSGFEVCIKALNDQGITP